MATDHKQIEDLIEEARTVGLQAHRLTISDDQAYEQLTSLKGAIEAAAAGLSDQDRGSLMDRLKVTVGRAVGEGI